MGNHEIEKLGGRYFLSLGWTPEGKTATSGYTASLADVSSARYSLADPSSIASLLPRPKLVAALETPVVEVVDGGRLYDPLVDELTRGGMAVFRSSDSAIRTLARSIEGRRSAEQLRG